MNNLSQYLAEIANIYQQLSRSQGNKQTQQLQPSKNVAQAAPQTQQLNAENLQQQQAAYDKRRQATMKTNNNKPPAAPTTSHVPFPFGSQSPQGVPQIYVPKKNELTQEKLQLPVPKKHKKNQVQTTPGIHTASPSKVESPEAQRHPAVAAAPIKCPEPDCKHPPFTSKALLEKHTKDLHESKDEQITDPLEYVLGGLRMALNLDEQGQSKHADAKLSTSNMTAMSQGSKSIKQDATVSSTSKTITGRKTNQSKISTPISKDISQPTADPWATTSIPQHWFSEVFQDVVDPNRALTSEFLTSWLEVNPAPELSSADDDSPQSVGKSSSHKSDISPADNIDITIVGEDGLLTENWFDIAGDMNAFEMVGLTDMDWDTNMDAETAGSLGKRADGDASDEWLKVYAPDKYNERVKKEKKAGR